MDVRKDFPILKRKINGKPLIYFDNAATTQKPVQVLDAIRDFYENHYSNVGRGVHTLTREATDEYEAARKNLAKFINAKPEEIIFTSGTTQGLNMVAQAYEHRLNPTDSIITSVMEHHSNYLPIKFLARKTGCNVRLVGMDSDGNLDIESYTKAIGTKSALVSITHASNVLGTINPAKELAKAAHEAGAVFVLDAAQSAPHLPIDVKKLDCDFMAFSGHKMLGPTGIGVLYGKKDLLDAIEPPLVGGGAVSKTCPGEIEFLESPHKFEAGTPNIAGAIGLSAAVDYLNKIGMKEVQKHEEALTKTALKGLSKIETYGPKNRVGVVSFNIDGVSAEDIAIILDENGIAIRSGHHCAQPLMCRLKVDGTARMSFYLYNTEEEVDFAIDVLNKIKKLG